MSGAAAGLPLPCPFVVPLVNGFTSRREIVSCWVLVSLLEPVELLQLETLHRQHHALDAAAVERALRRASITSSMAAHTSIRQWSGLVSKSRFSPSQRCVSIARRRYSKYSTAAVGPVASMPSK
jgi:hypothetical protein